MPTSAGRKPSSNNVKGSNDRQSNIGACRTARSRPHINRTDEANVPLNYATMCFIGADGGTTLTMSGKPNLRIDAKKLVTPTGIEPVFQP